jgi:hypothetical protein
MKVCCPARSFPAVCVLLLLALSSTLASTNIVLWDTLRSLDREAVTPKEQWKVVPPDLMELEKDPAKASSDPGYYGREYRFTGDVVVENNYYVASFHRGMKRISLSAKPASPVADIVFARGGPVQQVELIRNSADEVVLAIGDGKTRTATLSFGKDCVVEIKPTDKAEQISLQAPMAYGVVPGFVADDLLYGPAEAAGPDSMLIPAENMFVGLMQGGNASLVVTWPGSQTHAALTYAPENQQRRVISGLNLETGGQSVYLGVMGAPSVWHQESLDAKFLEKDVAIDWKPPFAAKWQTQLFEGTLKTRFAFRESKGTVWRGVPGSYNYPVWFEGDKPHFFLSKKVPPKGEAIIYFLEGRDTPSSVMTPVDIVKATLGRAAAESILDVEGRKLRTHHGDCGSDVHRACTCGYTEAIQAVFEKGEETEKKGFVDQSIRDMIYFVQRHLARIDEYRGFASSLSEYVRTTAKTNPALKDYLEDIDATAQQIPQEYENQKENMKSLEFAAELEQKTMALTGKHDPNNLKSYMELLKAWRAMGGSQDYLVAQCHILARKIFQDAGYNCVSSDQGVAVAKEIRARCKQVLRNPDGYEIWPNY